MFKPRVIFEYDFEAVKVCFIARDVAVFPCIPEDALNATSFCHNLRETSVVRPRPAWDLDLVVFMIA